MTDPGYSPSTPEPTDAPTSSYIPPQPGYTPAPGGQFTPPPPPPGYASADEKQWVLIAHFGAAIGAFISGGVLGFVAPLISLLNKGKESPTVRANALTALNYQIPLNALGLVVGIIRTCALGSFTGFGYVLYMLFWLFTLAIMAAAIIFPIIAGMRANEGGTYKYPYVYPVVK